MQYRNGSKKDEKKSRKSLVVYKKAVPLHPQTGKHPGAKRDHWKNKKETKVVQNGVYLVSEIYKERKYESRQYKSTRAKKNLEVLL